MDKLFQKLTLEDHFEVPFKMQGQEYTLTATGVYLLDSGEIHGNISIDTAPHSSSVFVADVAIAGKAITRENFKYNLLLKLAARHSLIPRTFISHSQLFDIALMQVHTHYQTQYKKIEDAIERGGLEEKS